MLLQKLRIERLRNLKTVALNELQPFNVFYGKNGSGKTSILEAIHLLATGRSFRTYVPRHYIQYQQQDTLVFAQSYDYRIGLQKFQSGDQVMKVNGDSVATQGQLAKLLPVQVIEPQSTDIIDHGAKPRRQMLDWLMFHVEPDFFPIWQNYSRALKQRNRLLKLYPVPREQIQAWDQILAQEGERIHLLRELIVDRWQQDVQTELQILLPDMNIELEYFSGFSTEIGLAQQLQQELQKDIERKTTQHGVHRADLRLKTGFGYADDVLSRGQKKLLIIALKLAQIAMLHRSNKETVVLLDDLTAELDTQAQQRLIKRLHQLGSQVFLTTLDQQAVQSCLKQTEFVCQFYAVESGQVCPVDR
ncbi:DNA replication/repair protein RecF [Acinetobacter qingfengensis]|uniref:DNA replication and repair protein RecF n=1 Tax=Acinetobacter qingfengensis TaxID=1262585 RepID=A0A1E7R1S7_9GAMM|nr:DNA replication/repair protein RecF [Acinetobacter qingfengensis]KAA8731233.1 DNA replication/repair protein RecF [Acinetobacter qingfengensis]OEY93269.1 DNA recombination protein RecF [Acinetobacter qingfengensis]